MTNEARQVEIFTRLSVAYDQALTAVCLAGNPSEPHFYPWCPFSAEEAKALSTALDTLEELSSKLDALDRTKTQAEEEGKTAILAEDGNKVFEGSRIYNYYDMKAGHIVEGSLVEGDSASDPWFDVLHDDGTHAFLNGQRICTIRTAQGRSFPGATDRKEETQ